MCSRRNGSKIKNIYNKERRIKIMEKKYCELGLNAVKALKDYRQLLFSLSAEQLLFLDYLVNEYNKKGECEPWDKDGMSLIARFIEGLSDVDDFISDFKDLEFDKEFFSIVETSTYIHCLLKTGIETNSYHTTIAMLERINVQQNYQEFIVAVGYNEEKNDWDYGDYFGKDKKACLKEFQKRVKLQLSEIKIPNNKPCYSITINDVQYVFTNILKTDYPYKGYRIGNMVLDNGQIGKVEHQISPTNWETRQEI
jgi:hypothetical protein